MLQSVVALLRLPILEGWSVTAEAESQSQIATT